MKTKLCKPILIDSKESIRINSIVYHPTFKLGRIIIESKTLWYYSTYKSGGSITSPLYGLINKLTNKQIILVSLDKDDEIKSGDLITDGNSIIVAPNIDGFIGFRKVIATQDQLSPEYIQQFIEEYNNGKVENIKIEIEELLTKVYDNIGGHPGGHWEGNGFKPLLSNGFITIVEREPDKDKSDKEIIDYVFDSQPVLYTEQDIIDALHSAELKHNKNYSKIYQDMKDWFYINKKK